MIYVVLGMHKSGTTLVSQILHHSGINMVDDLDESVSYDQGNKYERQSALHLDMDILGVRGYGIIDLAAPERLVATAEQRARMAEIIDGCASRYSDWGFKDPRACLAYPLWRELLPEHKLIVVYRPAAQLWSRFADHSFLGSYKKPSSAWRYLCRWYEHNTAVLAHLADTSCGYLVLSYTELMTDDREFDRLQSFVGRDLSDRRRKDLFRGQDRTYSLLQAADWWLKRRQGMGSRDVMDRLDAYRR